MAWTVRDISRMRCSLTTCPSCVSVDFPSQVVKPWELFDKVNSSLSTSPQNLKLNFLTVNVIICPPQLLLAHL